MSDQDYINLINGSYVIAAVLFIMGLMLLRSPATARNGNRLSALAMLIAAGVTLVDRNIIEFEFLAGGVVAGAVIGVILARTVNMTAMPQMVALFNAFGGGASALLASSEFIRLARAGDVGEDVTTTIMLATAIGALTLTGSLIAAGKLIGWVTQNPILFPLRNVVSGLIALLIVAIGVILVVEPVDNELAFAALVGLALLLGVLLVTPIGGADMPVVVALFNSYSGLAGAATGFALGNDILIIAGALVGASGLILTRIMTRAMNRSLINVMFGGFGASGTEVAGVDGETRPYRSVQAQDAAMMLGYANSVIFVPGYGLAVAQAQHELRTLADLLQARGVKVKYAIHPVAGRMPGHMNVLLAEADVPYDQLYDLDHINREFGQTDVAVVVGANDVVNPAARDREGSPIYGMPILNADHAQSVIVLKRSMASGFAGIDNDLFYLDRTSMLFGDAKQSVASLVSEIEDL
ncbi:MAG: NAD(P)(+) transhydrogenase (Re/Si-specific) subunit beta [Chloroflexi bacterium]|nr:NAD(P)(+) transhydrogenase (Re/Si-specific) subunit beta [Chloroflexota bacterium]